MRIDSARKAHVQRQDRFHGRGVEQVGAIADVRDDAVLAMTEDDRDIGAATAQALDTGATASSPNEMSVSDTACCNWQNTWKIGSCEALRCGLTAATISANGRSPCSSPHIKVSISSRAQ